MRMCCLGCAGMIAVAALACASPDSRLPTQPPAVTAQPQPEPPPLPPPPPPDARRIGVGAVVREELENWPLPQGCPSTSLPGISLPCRHFAVVAPDDGTLQVSVDWMPQEGAERVGLIVAGVVHDGPEIFINPQTVTLRVRAGAVYGITVAYMPSHYDWIIHGPDLIGEFSLETRHAR